MDRHVWQRLAAAILTALVIFSTSAFSPVGSDDGLGITTIQTKKKIHQLPNLLDQQTAISVGLDINSSWVREQSVADNLIYSIVKPDNTVPTGTNEGYSHLVTSSRDREIPLFFKAGKKKVTIKHANHGEKLHTKTVSPSRLVEQSYRIRKQCQQVDKYTSVPRAERLIGHRKLGL